MNQPLPSPLSGGQPRYLVLAQALVDAIKTGRYPLNSLLPTEHELCKQFNVSRHTVREAIRRLNELGLISKQQGVGTRVKATQAASRYVQASEGISDLHQYVRDVRMELGTLEDISADEELAELLECKPGQAWVMARGLRHREGDSAPLAHTLVYVPRAYATALEAFGDGRTPIYELLQRRFGLQVAEVRQTLSAVNLDADVARALQVRAGSPGLHIVRKYYGGNDELLEVAVNVHPGERFSYSISQRLIWQGANGE
ncbi:GntR family transcriptional regulator [Phytopseudomonas dryadis]|uniref:GntR family transcriptional regulator n=1 Tax=Phytopseudomonas dryadis TaxID=2487520 RepID=A0A4Q9QZR0_9GAMM|nr:MULTISPECIES: GntR family transcriptional regulator [Pseudomonas]TBU90303.1 GntR family transcriptional regulator [Pseudomonas dryadis]TBV04435.1 GntR family transcriptional regulator [Pseudomonas dryadis]TBV17161.1 GntR family transcriptional regulator [Pseudomonas sp. FRB 230]